MTTATTIRDALEQTYAENHALLASLRDADMDRPTPNRGWRVRQLAGHIAEDDGGTLFVGKLLARGKNAKAPTILVDLANWWGLRKYKKAHAAELLPVMETKHHELLAWLEALPTGALDQGGEVSGMGRLTLAEFLVRNCDHSRAHAADLRSALGR